MQSNRDKTILPVPLYHGTSTLFLDSIIKNGLGGVNIVEEWSLLEIGKEVYQLSEIHINDSDIFNRSGLVFKTMLDQSNSGTFNWQHGNTYLSVSYKTAINYSCKPYGSELLSYIFDFYKELEKSNIQPDVKNLYNKNIKLFNRVYHRPSPILIEVKNIPISYLLDEKGNNCSENLFDIEETINDGMDLSEWLPQCNFRLTHPISINNLKIWHINFQQMRQYSHIYNLYEIKLNPISSPS